MLPPIFKCRAIDAWSMPMRLPSAWTTLETALTIPVNIHVSSYQEVGAEPGRIELAQSDSLGKVLDSGSPKRTRRFATPDETWRDIRVDLVHQAFRDKRCVNRAAPLYQ